MPFNEQITQLTTKTKNHASVFNEVNNQLHENTKYNKAEHETLKADHEIVKAGQTELISEVEILKQTTETAKADIVRVEGEVTTLKGKHDTLQTQVDAIDTSWKGITGKPESFPPSPHNHKASEITGIVTSWNDLTDKPESFPPSTHNHDDVYYTETETDAKLAEKAPIIHEHSKADIKDFAHRHNASEIDGLENVGGSTVNVFKRTGEVWGSFVAEVATSTFTIAGYDATKKCADLFYKGLILIPNQHYTITLTGEVTLTFELQIGETIDYCLSDLSYDYNELINKPDLDSKANQSDLQWLSDNVMTERGRLADGTDLNGLSVIYPYARFTLHPSNTYLNCPDLQGQWSILETNGQSSMIKVLNRDIIYYCSNNHMGDKPLIWSRMGMANQGFNRVYRGLTSINSTFDENTSIQTIIESMADESMAVYYLGATAGVYPVAYSTVEIFKWSKDRNRVYVTPNNGKTIYVSNYHVTGNPNSIWYKMGDGGDADTVDGYHATQFAKASEINNNMKLGKYITFYDYDDAGSETTKVQTYLRDSNFVTTFADIGLNGYYIKSNLESVKSTMNTISAYEGSNGYCRTISSQNLNDIKTNGRYQGLNMTNAPNSNWWYVEVFAHNANYTKQVAYELHGFSVYIRQQVNGTWSAWQQVSTGGSGEKTAIVCTARAGYAIDWQNSYQIGDVIYYNMQVSRSSGFGSGQTQTVAYMPTGKRPAKPMGSSVYLGWDTGEWLYASSGMFFENGNIDMIVKNTGLTKALISGVVLL